MEERKSNTLGNFDSSNEMIKGNEDRLVNRKETKKLR